MDIVLQFGANKKVQCKKLSQVCSLLAALVHIIWCVRDIKYKSYTMADKHVKGVLQGMLLQTNKRS